MKKMAIISFLSLILVACLTEDSELRSGEQTCSASDGTPCTCGFPACDGDGTGNGGGAGAGGGGTGPGHQNNYTCAVFVRNQPCYDSYGYPGRQDILQCCSNEFPDVCYHQATECVPLTAFR